MSKSNLLDSEFRTDQVCSLHSILHVLSFSQETLSCLLALFCGQGKDLSFQCFL